MSNFCVGGGGVRKFWAHYLGSNMMETVHMYLSVYGIFRARMVLKLLEMASIIAPNFQWKSFTRTTNKVCI